MRMILIGNPGNRRTTELQAARAKAGLPPATVLPYIDLLQGRASLAEAAFSCTRGDGLGGPVLLRLDAPGECFEVERELIAYGAPDVDSGEALDRQLPLPLRMAPIAAPSLPAAKARAIKEQRGRLYHPAQWFRGYCRLLARLAAEAKAIGPDAIWLNAPGDIAAMFDKRETHRILSAAGVNVPRLLAPPEAIADYETLRRHMSEKRMRRIFLKLAFGSGACGVIAYQVNPSTGAELAVTTIGVEHFNSRPPVFYNVKKLHRYSDSFSIRQIVDWLLRHGAHAEQWVPKASLDGSSFDIRQLVVDGEACHSVARVSRTPITNLHLRSVRMSLREAGLSEAEQRHVRDCAERTLAVFPGSAVAGIDIAVSEGSRKPFVLDVNPFGDLLYQVRHEGYDPYEWQMKRLAVMRSTPGKVREERTN